MKKGNTPKQKTKTRKESKSHNAKGNTIETLLDAFTHELSDMQNAERQLAVALPKMAKAASNADLSKAFETHLKETQEQIPLIEKAAKSAGVKLKRKKCDAMQGLIEESRKIIKDVGQDAVRDAMLISAAQKIEHYEIAGYGFLVAAARKLGYSESARFLEQILDQEKQADQKLNHLAEQSINDEAAQQDFTTQEGEKTMARMNRNDSQYRERDEEGRFVSNNGPGADRGYNRRGGSDYDDDRSYSRSNRDEQYDSRSSRYEEDDYDDNRSYARSGRDYDDDRSGRGGNRHQQRDDEGRFMSNDDRQNWGGNHSSRSGYASDRDYNESHYSRAGNDSGYYDDNRSRRGTSGGQGRGWFGDSEGHARAGRHSHDNDRNRNYGRR